jgi:formate hydrogenlyase subunit 4
MMEILNFLLAYLIFPGLLFTGVVSLLFVGIDRKVAAHMQNRIGPPIWQEFFDVGKLLGKEDITPTPAQSSVFTMAPLLAFGAIVTVMMLLPVNSAQPALVLVGDLIVIIYLLNIPAICLMLGGYSSACPFGASGASRYVVQLFGYELAFIIAALAVAVKVGSLNLSDFVGYQAQHGWFAFDWRLLPAFIASLIAIQGKLLRVPFDIPEAEVEIVHGPLTEYSGPKLALMRIAYDIEVLAVAGFITALFLGGPTPFYIAGIRVPGVVSFLIKCLAVVLFTTTLRCIAARLRIDQAVKFFWTFTAILAIVSLLLVI